MVVSVGRYMNLKHVKHDYFLYSGKIIRTVEEIHHVVFVCKAIHYNYQHALLLSSFIINFENEPHLGENINSLRKVAMNNNKVALSLSDNKISAQICPWLISNEPDYSRPQRQLSRQYLVPKRCCCRHPFASNQLPSISLCRKPLIQMNNGSNTIIFQMNKLKQLNVKLIDDSGRFLPNVVN